MRRVPVIAVPVVALLLGLPGVVAPGAISSQVAYTAAFGGLVIFAWLGVRRRTGPARVAHALVAGGLTVWLSGDLLYAALVWRHFELGAVSAADVLWVAGYPLLAAGLVAMARLRAPGRLREAALDVLAMATVVAAVFWQFMVVPSIDGQGLSWGVLFTAFYPFGDVLLFAAGTLIVLSPGRWGAPNRYLVGALALTFAGDVVISAASLVAPEFDTGQVDPVLLLANALLAAALGHPDAEYLTETRPPYHERLHPARVVLLGGSLLSLPALNYVGFGGDPTGRLTMLATMVLLTAIVLIRFTLAVREQERASAALTYRATHDELTGLVNRQELHTRITAVLHDRGRSGPTVHFLDLNGFKPINDQYGHAAGDFVLTEVATRLRAAARTGDTVARLGGDEFVVLSDGVADPAALAERLRAAIAAPMRYGEQDLRLGVSIGYASATGPGECTSDDLLAAADLAMYREKYSTPDGQHDGLYRPGQVRA